MPYQVARRQSSLLIFTDFQIVSSALAAAAIACYCIMYEVLCEHDARIEVYMLASPNWNAP